METEKGIGFYFWKKTLYHAVYTIATFALNIGQLYFIYFYMFAQFQME